jgi:hypothetical protein
MRVLDFLITFVLGAVIGVIVYISWWEKGVKYNPMPDEKQHVLLERIKKVAKLVTVEGDYTTNHEYNDYYWANISIFSRQMVLTSKAKIFVGYDLQEATFEADSVNKIIRVRNLPKPKVLAIEHDVQVPVKREGLFSGFSGEDLTDINIVIKKKLKDSTTVAPLLKQAEEDGIATLDIIRILVEQGGWTFEIVDDKQNILPKPQPADSLKKDSIRLIPNVNPIIPKLQD